MMTDEEILEKYGLSFEPACRNCGFLGMGDSLYDCSECTTGGDMCEDCLINHVRDEHLDEEDKDGTE